MNVNHLSKSIKASFWFVLCNFLQKTIQVITIPVITRLISTEDYGLYTIYNSWNSVFIIVLTFGMSFDGCFNGLKKFGKRKEQYISSIQFLITLIAFIWYIIYLIFSDLVHVLTGLDSIMIHCLFIQVLLYAASDFYIRKNKYSFSYRNVVRITLFVIILTPVLNILSIYLFEQKVYGLIFSSLLVLLMFYGPIFINNFRKGKTLFNKKYWHYSLHINIPLIPHYLSSTILNQFDRIMINAFFDSARAGIYSVAYSAGNILNLFNSAINSVILPWSYKKLEVKNVEAIKKTTDLVLISYVVMISIFISLAPELMNIFASKEYNEAIYIMPFISLCTFFMFLCTLFTNIELYFEKSNSIMVSTLVAAILNILLNYILLPRFGYIVASITTLVSYIVMTLLHYYFMRNICKKNMITNVYDEKKILYYSYFLCLYTIINIIFYDYVYIRYILVLFFLMLILINREKFIHIVKEIKMKERK